MSGVLKVVSQVAGVIAMIPSPIQPIAAAVAVTAGIGAQLTARKPAARGSANNILVQSDAPSPCLIGRTYYGGVMRHDVGYGGTVNSVPNPYRALVMVYSVAGPVKGLVGRYADYATIPMSGNAGTGYWNGFLYSDFQVGQTPEGGTLTPQWGGVPNWTAAHKLSGKAAILWNLKFDRKGKVFAGGVPQLGAVWEGVMAYDPRKDSTYPGGSGSHRIGDESTWEYSECPGLHGLAYAYGRHQNGKKVFGVGQSLDGIEVAHFVELANVCDANGWTVGGVIYEPGDRWQNLKDILAAGGAEPVFTGGKLGLRINAPRVALDTITAADLAEDDISVVAMQTWRARINGIVPKYRSEVHKWEYVPSTLVSVPTYVTEDGEEKNEERQWNLVQDADQVAKLAAYDLVNARELGPIDLVCKPRMRGYGPGDMLIVDLPDAGLVDQPCIVLRRALDPGTLKVTLTLIGETEDKHDYALGRTGNPPPTPSLTAPEDIDDAASLVRDQDPRPIVRILPSLSSFRYDAAGMAVPSGQFISFSADKQNTTESVFWAVFDGDGNPKTPASDYLSDNEGDTVTMTEPQFASARGSTNGVRVQAQVVDGSFTARDVYPISYVSNGADGITGSISTPSINLIAYEDGTLVPGQLDFAVGTFRVFTGGTEVTTGYGVVYELAGEPTGCTGTIDAATGAYALTSLTDVIGVLPLRATYGGVTIPANFNVTKNAAQPLPATVDIVQDLFEFTFDYLGAPDPAGQVLTFRAENKSADVDVHWKVFDANGIEQLPTTDFLSSASGDVVTMSIEQFEAARNGTQAVGLLMTLGDGLQFKGLGVGRKVGAEPGRGITWGPGSQTVRVNAAGTLDPSGQVLSFGVQMQNLVSTPSWKVYDGAGAEKTPTSDYLSATTGTDVTMTGAQALAAMGATNTLKVVATVPGVPDYLLGDYPFSVVLTGDGASALDLRVKGNRTNITRDAFGRIWPASQPTTITAERINFTGGTTTWTIQDGNGNYLTPVTDYLSAATGDSVTIAADKVAAAAGASRQVTIWAGNGAFNNPWSIQADGLPGPSDNLWPDPQLNTGSTYWPVAAAAPWFIQTDGVSAGYQFKNYVWLYTAGATSEVYLKVVDGLPVRYAGEIIYLGFAGGRVAGTATFAGGVYVKWYDAAGAQIGSAVKVTTNAALTPSSDWSQINGQVQAPSDAATFEVGYVRLSVGTVSAASFYIAAPYAQRTPPDANNTDKVQSRMITPDIHQVIDVTSDGQTVKSFQGALQATRFWGPTDVTTTTAWTIANAYLCSASIGAATGIISLSSVTGPGYFDIVSTYNNLVLTQRIFLEYNRDLLERDANGNVANASSSASGVTITATTITPPTVLVDVHYAETKANGVLAFYGAGFARATSGQGEVEIYPQYRVAGSGGAWTTTVPVMTMAAQVAYDAANPKIGRFGGATSGINVTANTKYEVRWVALKKGTATSMVVFNTVFWVRGT